MDETPRRDCGCPRFEHYAAAMSGEPPECVAKTMTINQHRALADLPPIPGGDVTAEEKRLRAAAQPAAAEDLCETVERCGPACSEMHTFTASCVQRATLHRATAPPAAADELQANSNPELELKFTEAQIRAAFKRAAAPDELCWGIWTAPWELLLDALRAAPAEPTPAAPEPEAAEVTHEFRFQASPRKPWEEMWCAETRFPKGSGVQQGLYCGRPADHPIHHPQRPSARQVEEGR